MARPWLSERVCSAAPSACESVWLSATLSAAPTSAQKSLAQQSAAVWSVCWSEPGPRSAWWKTSARLALTSWPVRGSAMRCRHLHTWARSRLRRAGCHPSHRRCLSRSTLPEGRRPAVRECTNKQPAGRDGEESGEILQSCGLRRTRSRTVQHSAARHDARHGAARHGTAQHGSAQQRRGHLKAAAGTVLVGPEGEMQRVKDCLGVARHVTCRRVGIACGLTLRVGGCDLRAGDDRVRAGPKRVGISVYKTCVQTCVWEMSMKMCTDTCTEM